VFYYQCLKKQTNLHDRSIKYFTLLKQNIVYTMQKSFPGIKTSISDWRGQDITDFQEDLLEKVNAHISEKWFYNHIKTENKSLPRIDVLNLLSKYVGYANWDDFVYKNTDGKINIKSISKANQIFIILPLVVIFIMSVLVLLFQFFNNREREYSFDFYDSYTKEIIKNNRCEIKLLSDNESPIHYLSDSTGRVVLKTNKSVVTMLISAPYYKSDTIIRILKKFDRAQKISLQINDYALILHYFSEMNVDDWQRRRDYLVEIIDNGAIFYQVLNDKNKQGMALYNKTEFIDKLTMPTGSLKFIEILDTKFKNDKIVLVRFRINKLSK